MSIRNILKGDVSLLTAFMVVHLLGMIILFLVMYFLIPKIYVFFSTDIIFYKYYVFWPVNIIGYLYLLFSLIVLWQAAGKQKNNIYL